MLVNFIITHFTFILSFSEVFTRDDIKLMISLTDYISNLSSRVALEKQMLARSKEPRSIPVGNETTNALRLFTIRWGCELIDL